MVLQSARNLHAILCRSSPHGRLWS